MKKLLYVTLAASISLAAGLSAETKPKVSLGPLPSNGWVAQACVPVSCNGQAAGTVCGDTTQELVERAIALCAQAT